MSGVRLQFLMKSARVVIFASVLSAGLATGLQAQDGRGDERIEDPELGPSGQCPAGSAADGVIEDPELAGAPAAANSSSASSSSPPDPQSADVHMVLHGRMNRDLQQGDPREEIWEGTVIAALDATLRRSESLRFSIGLLARYHVGAFAKQLPDARAARYEFDVMPTSGYADVSIASGLHLRVGYQPLHLGRFEIFSGSDQLAVRDLRDGLATLPEVAEVGQFAFLLDYDPSSWLSVRMIYVPFFLPHLISLTESDYALVPNKQTTMDAGINAFEDIVPTDRLRVFVANNLSRTTRDRLGSAGLAAFAPSPALGSPQGAIRFAAHGTAGELALTASTTLEHLPTFHLSDAAIKQLTMQPSTESTPNDPRPISVEFKRFATLTLDGAVDVDPFSIGLELSYMLHRTLYAVGNAYTDDPLSIPVPGYTDLAQVGARVEYVQSTTWLMVVEAFASYAMSLPADRERGWMFLESGHYYRGVGGLFGWSPEFGLRVQLSAAWLSGPSVIFSPRIGFAFLDHFEIEVGALIVEGQAPAPYATPVLSIGGLYNNLDHVFVGLRYAN
jgi:hypothetical protein